MDISNQRQKAGWIIASIFLFEGLFVSAAFFRGPERFMSFLGFLPGLHRPALMGWPSAILVAAMFIWYTRRLPSVRTSMFRFDWLKLLAIGMALSAGILEEWAFRSILMDSLERRGVGVLIQVLASALAFGLMHAVWSLFRGSWEAGARACATTAALGTALALVYVASSRSLAPCITAHFLINAMSEPGLVLAAVRGEMHRLNGIARNV